jgi:plasmid stabilization system protein ParE
LDLELSSLEGGTDRQAAQIQVLEQELAQANAELERMDDPGVSPAEITQLRESVEERKRLIAAYLATVRQE